MVVHLQGSSAVRVVSVQEISQWFDLPQANYAIRSRPGQTDTASESVGDALSIRELVSRLAAEPGTAFTGVGPDSVSLVQVPSPYNSYVATLMKPNLGPAGANGFADSKLPAVFMAANDSVGYVRPLTDDVNDVNNRDYFLANTDSPIDLTLRLEGTPLTPTITADPDDPAAGDPVAFTVEVPDAPPGKLTYVWSFDGGGTSTDASPSHTWDAAGTYAATVVVTGSDGSTGQSSVTVSVGSRPQPTSTPTATATAATQGGGTDPDQDAPSKGPDQGSRGTQAGGKVTDEASPDVGSSQGAGTDGSGTSTTEGATGTSSGTDPLAPPPPALPSAPVPSAVVPPPTGEGSVTGLLLSSASLPLGAGAADDGAEPTAPTAREQPATTAVDPLVWAGLLVPLLLLAGAVGELRPGRPRSWRFRRVGA